MVTLSAIHYVYIIMTILILAALLCKKEIVIPCIIGVLLIGFTYSGSILKSIQILNNALVASCIELLGIIIVIALVVAMSKSMMAVGADEMMIRPIRKVIKTKNKAFFGIGFAMLIVSWLIWPSPAVALIGALLLPVAGEVGLPAIWAAVAMNIFGHGAALSSDFFIQGAPAISSKAAGLDVTEVMKASIPLWSVMCVVTIGVATYMMIQDTKKNPYQKQKNANGSFVSKEVKKPKLSRFVAILIPIAFLTDMVLMVKFEIAGGDATALVAGTALIIMCLITILDVGVSDALEKSTDYIKEGFIFAIRIFAPVIVIAAFFFMGSEGFAQNVLGENATGLLNDIGLFITERIPVSKVSIALVETSIGIITGLDGSGFSGLPLVGSIAQTFSASGNINTAYLTALGQISTIWVGGGTIIPWGVIPVAAICGIKPADLARKNLIPVICGLVATTIAAIFLI
ncbi:MAG: hypothetical protein PHY47_21190 [Lachnospiraceae bacterium]|nr:hypothetical protein [Lachnospiraceae bacterium]